MGRVADKRVASHVDDEVQVLERNLTDQNGHTVGNFEDVHRAASTPDRQPHRFVDGCFRRPCRAEDSPGTSLRETQLLDQTRGNGKERGTGIDQSISNVQNPSVFRRDPTAFRIPKILEVFDLRLSENPDAGRRTLSPCSPPRSPCLSSNPRHHSKAQIHKDVAGRGVLQPHKFAYTKSRC